MKRLLAVCAVAVMLSGCAARPMHPGSVDRFDDMSYDTLLVWESVIKDAKADLAAGIFPDTAKPALNHFIDAYNTYNKTVRAYHSAAQAGKATPIMVQEMGFGEAGASEAFAQLVKVYPKAGTKK